MGEMGEMGMIQAGGWHENCGPMGKVQVGAMASGRKPVVPITDCQGWMGGGRVMRGGFRRPGGGFGWWGGGRPRRLSKAL
jgi:hypothetical protein